MRSLLLRSSFAGLLIVALGCRSSRSTPTDAGATGGVGIDGAGIGGAGAMGGAVTGGGGATGGGSATGTAGTTGAAGATGTAGTGAAGAGGAVPFYPLDMNDVTILAPLPPLPPAGAPVLLLATDLADDGTALVPRALYDRVVVDGSGRPLPLLDTAYEALHLVAVRFDLCDRHLPGDCPDTEDARLRLVFQPILDATGAMDAGFHAFYTIRNDEIAGAVAALRDLAMTAPPQGGALRVSPALGAADPEPYAGKLRAFVRRYGGSGRIVRLTINALDLQHQAFVWQLRGVEKQGDAFADIKIVGTTAISQMVILTGSPGFDITPMTDIPSGFGTALSQALFDMADVTGKRDILGALAAADNPLAHTAETVPCVTCHVSTVVMAGRTANGAIDPLTLPARYTSTFDLSIAGGESAQTRFTIRALGYLRKVPMISQRVANDTAQTLTEIERRFPRP